MSRQQSSILERERENVYARRKGVFAAAVVQTQSRQ